MKVVYQWSLISVRENKWAKYRRRARLGEENTHVAISHVLKLAKY